MKTRNTLKIIQTIKATWDYSYYQANRNENKVSYTSHILKLHWFKRLKGQNVYENEKVKLEIKLEKCYV